MRIGVWKAVIGGGATVDAVLDDDNEFGHGCSGISSGQNIGLNNDKFSATPLLEMTRMSPGLDVRLTHPPRSFGYPLPRPHRHPKSSGTDCAGAGRRDVFDRLDACRPDTRSIETGLAGKSCLR
jgi:hypothetical protein